MTRRVQYSQNGDIDQLHIGELETPEAGAGEVRVSVRYAGLNPIDWKIVTGSYGASTGVTGVGSEFSGVIDQVGEGVEGFAVGDLVFGGRSQAMAEHLVISDPAEQLDKVPSGLGLETAGSLFIVGRTAVAGLRAIAPAKGETVVVSGASGGVGIVAAQIARDLGVRVIGLASERNHRMLHSLGIEAVAYGKGLEDRLRAAAPNGIHAAFLAQDASEIDQMLALGVPANRINSIGAGPTVTDSHGVHTAGNSQARREDLATLAHAIANGQIYVPISAVFALDEVQDAFRFLKEGGPVGKVALRFEADSLADSQRIL